MGQDEKMGTDIPVEGIGNLLDVVAQKLPGLFQSIRDSVFSAEASSEIATAVGNFYKTLIEKGIPEEKAYELTTEYLGTLKALSKSVNYDTSK